VIERRTEHTEYLTFELFNDAPHLSHAIFTRRRGFSASPFAGLNASAVTGDDLEVVRRNKAEIVAALGLPLVATMPVHGGEASVVERQRGDDGDGWHDRLQGRLRTIHADAMISDDAGFALCWAYGDCAPILLYDPIHAAFALVHAGWRGTAAGVVPHAIIAMSERYGTRPSDLLAGVGPAIGSCCYEVDEQVREAFARDPLVRESAIFEERPGERGVKHSGLYLDVAASNVLQLLASGVTEEHIETSGFCTGCRTDLFYSHRREPYPSGRFAVGIGLREA
jgi:purine-nucleoside/S-methyl-5'-thioadenosine phosphorylase / adenosine deaminase